MHKVEVDVQRLGGGFGGKEDQANAWAAICAVATQLTKRPVKYALHRMEDMRMTGKRHPYSSDYKIGLDKDLKIVAYEATFYQNAGASCDLSPAGARTHAFSLHELLFRPECHGDRLLLPHESAAEHCFSRIWRAAGDVRDRIGDRARGGKAWRVGCGNSTKKSDRRRRRIPLRPKSRKRRRSRPGRRRDAKYDFAKLQTGS